MREAIQAANTNAAFGGCTAGSGSGNGADTISILAGTYTLTLAGANEDFNATGDLDITENISLIGTGAATTIIDGNNTDRILHVESQFRVWNISGLTLQHGNPATSSGGAIYNGGALTITDSILSNNAGRSGGDAWGAIKIDSGGGVVQLRAGILDSGASGANCVGSITTQGSNVADDASCFVNAGTDKVVGDVGLGPLASNGGTTQTHALLAGSLGIDAVQGSCTSDRTGGGTLISTDQRGSPRPTDGDGNGSALCDVGAYEKAGSSPPTAPSVSNQITNEDTATSAIPFTISDPDTAAAILSVAATSHNQALIPDDSIQLGGSGANRTIRLTPAANQIGVATIDVAVSDGVYTTHATFTLTVNAVDDPPVAVNDSYSVIAGQQLVVLAAAGVLVNDTDVDGGSMGITSNTNTAHGTLLLYADGAITYTPVPGFTGVDTFTYRLYDGHNYSTSATVTITVATGTCTPRATVRVSTAIVSGKLQATLSVQPLNGGAANRLVELRFGTLRNAIVTVNGQPITSGATYAVPGNATQVTVMVGRVTPGQATTVPVTVVDECGSCRLLWAAGQALASDGV